MTSLRAACALTLAITCASCGQPDRPEPVASEAPTSALAPLDLGRSDGTTFDPCHAFTPSELRNWGLTPQQVYAVGGVNTGLRGCEWESASNTEIWNLNMFVSNVTVQSMWDKGEKKIAVAGVDAAQHQEPEMCVVTLPAQRSSVSVNLGGDSGRAGIDLCAKAVEIAKGTLPKIPK
ncbi:hypothetical protein MSTE_03537 [Mycobacteroides stephanolepidis]|uniref:DUF3558 domain-containing protein n=1 Tax=[Mycobacterium] stephanolepidis TaxID=1520670 RepID=A0A1Z4F0X8_9MYCO|nr:DUF3558 family protein [[Mycobacterium] stephanolepidis]BAX98837.1 hypothetical protein MSTE_03537 [[Mycobacterium] stephanolepidis]